MSQGVRCGPETQPCSLLKAWLPHFQNSLVNTDKTSGGNVPQARQTHGHSSASSPSLGAPYRLYLVDTHFLIPDKMLNSTLNRMYKSPDTTFFLIYHLNILFLRCQNNHTESTKNINEWTERFMDKVHPFKLVPCNSILAITINQCG